MAPIVLKNWKLASRLGRLDLGFADEAGFRCETMKPRVALGEDPILQLPITYK